MSTIEKLTTGQNVYVNFGNVWFEVRQASVGRPSAATKENTFCVGAQPNRDYAVLFGTCEEGFTTAYFMSQFEAELLARRLDKALYA